MDDQCPNEPQLFIELGLLLANETTTLHRARAAGRVGLFELNIRPLPRITQVCEELIETKRFNLNYKIDYATGFLEPNHELHVFRMVQELMSNSIKYSEAQNIDLEVTTKKNQFYMQYKRQSYQ